jgi:hypothetical protein
VQTRAASLALTFFALACDKPTRTGTAVPPGETPGAKDLSGSAASAASSAEPPRQALPTAALADLDVASLKKKLACAGDTRRQACRILDEFEQASGFAPKIPSGEGRFIGNAYTLEKGAEKSDLLMLSVSQVPTSTVPAGELALHIGTGPVPPDRHDHGVKLANALSHGDTVSKNNQAAPYIKTWKAPNAQGTMQTSGSSVRLVNEEVYLRVGSASKVLLVRLKPQGASGGAPEGTFAELWAASW